VKHARLGGSRSLGECAVEERGVLGSDLLKTRRLVLVFCSPSQKSIDALESTDGVPGNRVILFVRKERTPGFRGAT
jgi:hypothetical protein